MNVCIHSGLFFVKEENGWSDPGGFPAGNRPVLNGIQAFVSLVIAE